MRKVRNIKNIVAGIFSVMLLVTSTVSANAATTYAVVVQCPECATGTVTQYTSRAYEHDETFPCAHNDNGYDLYAAYEVTVRRSCDSCSYNNTYTYTDHVYKSCHGHK